MENGDMDHSMSQVPNVWKSYLYKLQQEAPTPKAVLSHKEIRRGRPRQYSKEYHGPISCEQADQLLKLEGSYLVRGKRNPEGYFTLSLRLLGSVKHFRLYYDGQHFVGDKRFNCLEDLVADGLVTMYLENKAGDYINHIDSKVCYEKSPYMTLNSIKRNTVRAQKRPRLKQQGTQCSSNSDTSFDWLGTLKLGNATLEPNVDMNIVYEKSHKFHVSTFKGLNWCDYCGNFLWGIIAQGVRCDDCGFTAHKKCSDKVPSDCMPDLKIIRGVFGVDLTTLVKAHQTIRPFVVDKCIAEIEKRGLDVEGLYRVSGSLDEIEALKLSFDKDGIHAAINTQVCDDINALTGVLKLYFRLLPIPLITFQVYPKLIKAIKCVNLSEKLEQMQEAVVVLPAAHFNTLKYFMEHLQRIVARKEVNKMTAYNISTVFAPTLLPSPDLQKQVGIPQLKSECLIIEALIMHCKTIFRKHTS